MLSSAATSSNTAGEIFRSKCAWQECLQRWTPEDMDYVFKGERGGRPYELSRQWVTWHVIEHDLHHGGEFSFSLGAHGLTTPDL